MLKNFDINSYLNKANIKIDEERAEYLEYFDVAIKFAKSNNLIVTEVINYQMNLYATQNLVDISKKLSDELVKIGGKSFPSDYVSVSFTIPYQEHSININTRTLFKIYYFKKHMNIDILSKIAIRDSNTLPPELLLINICSKLYNPGKITEWSALFQHITKHYNKIIYYDFNKSYADLELDFILGGGDPPIDKIIDLVDGIVIGDYAIDKLFTHTKKRLQLISDKSPDLILDDLKVLKSLKYSICFKEHLIHIPEDIQLKKYTFYLTHKNQTHTFDVFNSTTYELVPIQLIDKYKIAGLITLLKFKLIDLWTVKVLNLMKNITFDKSVFDAYINTIKKLIERIDHDFRQDPFLVFNCQMDGTYVCDFVAKKEIKDSGKFMSDYYPILQKLHQP